MERHLISVEAVGPQPDLCAYFVDLGLAWGRHTQAHNHKLIAVPTGRLTWFLIAQAMHRMSVVAFPRQVA